MSSSIMFIIDAAINSLLGVLLMLPIPFQDQITSILGVPAVGHSFYTSLFGAVLIGIGIALVLETKGLIGNKWGAGFRWGDCNQSLWWNNLDCLVNIWRSADTYTRNNLLVVDWRMLDHHQHPGACGALAEKNNNLINHKRGCH